MHVEDLLIASQLPQDAISVLSVNQGFKLKVTGPKSCHLGCDVSIDDDSTLHFAPCDSTGKLVDCYHSNFGSKSKLGVTTPL